LDTHARRLFASLLIALVACLWVASTRSRNDSTSSQDFSEHPQNFTAHTLNVAVRSQSNTSHSQNHTLRRITVTPEHALNLNPALSGDGRRVAFESTASLTGESGGAGFHAYRADLSGAHDAFTEIAASRAPSPALSRDGTRLAFASRENLTGENADGNSEIFLYSDDRLRQLTRTSPRDPAGRTLDGNFQPSISDDGSHIAFASNRDLTGANSDANLEIFLFACNYL
jgi:Tol biopolymer transport system component